MLFRKRRLIAAYSEGADLVCLALYKVFLSVLSDVVGAQHTPEHLGSASANVINRLVLRPEARSDPRDGSDGLAHELREICDLQMVREAAATVLMFDVARGRLLPADQGPDRIEDAMRLGGPDAGKIWHMIGTKQARPDVVRSLALTFAGHLAEIANQDVTASLAG